MLKAVSVQLGPPLPGFVPSIRLHE